MNLNESCENLKSVGFGNMMDLTSSPLLVEKPKNAKTKKNFYLKIISVNLQFFLHKDSM